MFDIECVDISWIDDWLKLKGEWRWLNSNYWKIMRKPTKLSLVCFSGMNIEIWGEVCFCGWKMSNGWLLWDSREISLANNNTYETTKKKHLNIDPYWHGCCCWCCCCVRLQNFQSKFSPAAKFRNFNQITFELFQMNSHPSLFCSVWCEIAKRENLLTRSINNEYFTSFRRVQITSLYSAGEECKEISNWALKVSH